MQISKILRCDQKYPQRIRKSPNHKRLRDFKNGAKRRLVNGFSAFEFIFRKKPGPIKITHQRDLCNITHLTIRL